MDLQRNEQFAKKLLEYEKIRITEKELRKIIPVSDYEDYYNIVTELVKSNIIIPVKKSGSNGMYPPLYKRYSIAKPENQYDELIPEIRLLYYKLNIEGYLANPEKYQKHKPWLLPIDDFLKHNSHKLKIPLSINERSFQIFRREKALREDKELAAVLSFNPGLIDALNYYLTPEPFFTYNIADINIMESINDNNRDKGSTDEWNVLIIENKDTWYTLKNIMSPKRNRLAGVRIDSLIYGEGKKIARKADSLTEFDKSFFRNVKANYYYFGDLDYEGIGILYDLVNVNPKLKIELMRPLYIAMLKTAQGVDLPVAKEKQIKKAEEVDWFISFFEPRYQSLIMGILEMGRYIPQEILNNGDFSELVFSKGG